MRTGRTVAGVLALAGLLTACSQTAALAPVGGNRLTEVRFAAIDQLAGQHIAVLVAPVCSGSGPDGADIACSGTTVDQQPIAVASPGSDRSTMTVKVGTRTIYAGPYLAVLTSAGQATS